MLISIFTFGCKVNQFESHLISEKLTELNFNIVERKYRADIFILNTCTVTSKTDYQVKQTIKRILNNNNNPIIIATGCLSQTQPDELKKLNENIVVIKNKEKFQLIEYIIKNFSSNNYLPNSSEFDLILKKPFNRTRAFLKVQDGCENYCSYCIIPYARGKNLSFPPESILKQIEVYKENNIKEIILTGINLSNYGLDINSNLIDLLKIILPKFSDIRFRLSSLEVNLINDELITLFLQYNNLCPHFHIPLQSGSDKILKLMNRKYNTSYFKDKIYLIKKLLPSSCIGLDVIVGFPDETDYDFYTTYSFIENLPISYLHVFPYSKRPYTQASKMKNQIPENIKKERVKSLIDLGKQKRQKFYQENFNNILTCLIETLDNDLNMFTGYTQNYIHVNLPLIYDKKLKLNNFVDIKIKEIQEDRVYAEPI